MKKIMFAAMAVLAITSCSQSEEFDAPGSKSEISFNTAVTRGTVLVTADFEQFKAYGYAHADDDFSVTTAGTEIMDGTFDYTASSWAEKDGKKFYWPAAGKVAFFGYSPVADATYAYSSPGYPTVAYTVNAMIAEQKDFVVAAVPGQAKVARVALPFKHALTQVLFKLKGNDAAVDYSVTKVVLKGIKDEGIYDFGTKTWDVSADETTVDYTIDLSPAVTFKGEAAATALNANDQLLILMPQEISGVSVEVSYTATKGGVDLFTGTLQAALNTTWLVGEKNTYTLALKAGEEIEVTGSLDDTWTEKSEDAPVN